MDRISAPHFVHFSDSAIILSVVGTASGNDGTAATAAAGLSPDQRAAVTAYLRELDVWNRRLNLTTVPAADAWRRHVGESLELLHAAAIPPGADVIDVGSGGGVPGVVVAIARPDLRVSLLESDTRKCGFLVHVAGLLGLDSLRVIDRRAEVAGHDPELRERFDVALSRATAPAPALCELALPLVTIGGRLAALLADAAAAAIAAERASTLCGGAPPQAAGGVLTIAKIAPTPERYPRRAGVPVRRPLH